MKKNLFLVMILVVMLSFLIVFTSVSCKDELGEEETEVVIQQTDSGEDTADTTTDGNTVDETSADDTTTNETTTDDTTTNGTTSTGQGTNLTQEEALNIAMTVASGTVDEIETEVEHGELIWKIRIVSGESRTVVRIKDSTGEIVRVETD